MAIPKTNRYTAAEYLALEEKALDKSEFHNGEIIPMQGRSLSLSTINVNVGSELVMALKGTAFRVFESSLKIRIEQANVYVYADNIVVRGKPVTEPATDHAIINPMLVTQVLSEYTEAYYRGEKFHLYQQIPSFKEYMLIEQKSPQVDVFYKNDKGQWMLESYFGLDAVAELHSLNIKISLADIYRRVKFG